MEILEKERGSGHPLTTPTSQMSRCSCARVLRTEHGGAGFSPAFSAAIGAKQIHKMYAVLLFTACSASGVFHRRPRRPDPRPFDLPSSSIDRKTALIVIASASTALFVANFARVPSRRVGDRLQPDQLWAMRGNLTRTRSSTKLLPAWIAVPRRLFITSSSPAALSAARWNYRLYEHLSKHEWKLRLLVIASSCYLGIAAGANHVANVVGPLSSGVFQISTGMLLFTPLFGIGAIFLSPAKTMGGEVVPLGLYSAAIVTSSSARWC